MPQHGEIKLIPGADTNKTLAYNENAISFSQYIRFRVDRSGLGLAEKIGGWQAFFNSAILSPIRALLAWEGMNTDYFLGVGAEDQLAVIEDANVPALRNLVDISPRTLTHNVTVDCTIVSGSNEIQIKDTGTNALSSWAVFINTPIAVGGLILYGFYPISAVGADTYNIFQIDRYGNPENATSSETDAGAVPVYDTTSGDYTVAVTLVNHQLGVGDTYIASVSTTGGGVTIFGQYIVNSVTSADIFVINVAKTASGTATFSENGGDAQYIYYIADAPPPLGSGYGAGGYGSGGYGTGTGPPTGGGTAVTTTDWTLDNWGEVLLACPTGGPIYQWSVNIGIPNASVIWQGPPLNDGMCIAMPQRQVVGWQSSFGGVQDPLLLRWCDVGDYTVWNASSTNQAGSFHLPRGSKIIGCIQAPNQVLAWTDLALWAMNYIGPPDVYGFNELAVGCGLVGRHAMGIMGGTVYWMSQKQFFSFSSAGVEPVQCPVWDVIFQTINVDQYEKVRCAVNSQFGEVTWYFAGGGSSEVNQYVKYTPAASAWDFGPLARTAWIDQSVLGSPIGAGADNYIYQHEMGYDAGVGNPLLPIFRTGYYVIGDATYKSFIDSIWPDFKWGIYNGTESANIMITFNVVDYPGDTPRVYGPYTVTKATQYITPRFRGRLVAFQISSSDIGSFWRIGAIRYRYAPDGEF